METLLELLSKQKAEIESQLAAIKTKSFDLKVQEQKLTKALKLVEKQIEGLK